MKRVLLTGVTGMVGRNFLEHPSIKKYKILSFSILINLYSSNVEILRVSLEQEDTDTSCDV